MGKFRVRRTTILSISLAAFLAGLAAGRRVSIDGWYVLAFAGGWLLLATVKSKLAVLCFCLSLGALGIWRGSTFLIHLQPYRSLSKQPVILQGRAVSDAVYGSKSQLTFDVAGITVLHPLQKELVGAIGVKGFGPAMVYRGDTVQVTGKLYPTRAASKQQ